MRERNIRVPEIMQFANDIKWRCPDIDIFKYWPTSSPDYEKTNIVWKFPNWSYLKAFSPSWKRRWATEHQIIELFNSFSKEKNSSFSWPEILDWGLIGRGYWFLMEDVKKWGKEEVDFSTANQSDLIKLYGEYRTTFDDFEKYSKGKISTSENPILQKIYAFSKEYSESLLWTLSSPLLKKAIAKKYQNKVNNFVSHGAENVWKYIKFDKSKINNYLENLISKVDKFDFEYNFGRFWTGHVFSDWKNHNFVDFDNVWYQIKWTEILGIARSNILLSVDKYESYEDRESNFFQWYNEMINMYKDENLIKLLLYVKLIWTIFEDWWHLFYEREDKKEYLEKWIKRNYILLKKLFLN